MKFKIPFDMIATSLEIINKYGNLLSLNTLLI